MGEDRITDRAVRELNHADAVVVLPRGIRHRH
jgi:hypothetical protein